MTRSPLVHVAPPRFCAGSRHGWLPRLVLLGLLVPPCFAAAQEPSQAPSVVALDLSFSTEIAPRAQQILQQRFALGLKASGFRVVSNPNSPAEDALSATACSAECCRQVAAQAHARYVAGGKISLQFDNYDLQLWLADGYSGQRIVEVKRRCDVCGIQAATETLELTASALRAELEAHQAQLALLDVATDPPGATLTVDGQLLGTSPRTLELSPGTHELRAQLAGYLAATRQLRVAAGSKQQLQLPLLAAAPPATTPWRPIGWAALGLGTASIVAGITLVALDGNDTGCAAGSAFNQTCSSRRHTATAGWITLGAGGALVAGGLWAILGTSSAKPTPTAPATVSLIPSSSGGTLSILGQF